MCSFIFSSGETCNEEAFEDSAYCFWHNPNVKKDKHDIKSQLEQKAKNDDSMEGYQLEGADLEDIHLVGADLRGVNLKRANVRLGHLYTINLEGANLFKVDFSDANLRGANLNDTDLLGIKLNNALLERVTWGDSGKIRNEIEAEEEFRKGNKKFALEKFLEAEEIYRNVKTNFKDRGLSHEGGKFFYREMIMKRKQLPLFSLERFWSKVIDIICGYGEYPFKIVTFSFSYIFFNALIFCFLGFHGSEGTMRFSLEHYPLENLRVAYNAVYYNFVTFTTLGYGDFSPSGIGKLFAFTESFIGAFLMAFFVITIYKQMMER